jgi:hypothetical protein
MHFGDASIGLDEFSISGEMNTKPGTLVHCAMAENINTLNARVKYISFRNFDALNYGGV